MPEWLTWVLALIGAVGGMYTGWATILRARGQTRNEAAKLASDDRSALFKDTREWLAYQDAQIAGLIARNERLEASLAAQAEKQAAHSAAHTSEITELQRQNRDQAAQLAAHTTQNAQQASQIEKLTEENASTTQQLKIEIAKREFVERENGELRREIERMKPLLPIRIEVTE